MKPLQLRLPSQRLTGALALLLMLLLALSTALSLSRTGKLDEQLSGFELGTLPTVRLLHGLGTGVEELRGMAALHLMLSGTAEMTALEAEIRYRRQQLGFRLAACARRLKGDADHQHYSAVQASLARFWVEQDRLAVLSRQAAADPVAAAAARALLVGAALQAFEQLGADIEAWWLAVEAEAKQQASRAHADAARTGLLLLGLVALALALSLTLAHTLLAAAGGMARLQAADLAPVQPDAVPAAAQAGAESAAESPAAAARAVIAQAQWPGPAQGPAQVPKHGAQQGRPDAPQDATPGALSQTAASATLQPISPSDLGQRARRNPGGANP